jgi:hypothetical protein
MKTKKALTPRKPGRPTVRTPEMADRICDAIGKGMPFNQACLVARIAQSVAMDWKATDQAFAERIQRAQAEFVQTHLARIEKAAAGGSWQASAWLLERRDPAEFGRNRLEVQHQHVGVVAVQHNFVVPKETLDEIASARARYEQQKIEG